MDEKWNEDIDIKEDSDPEDDIGPWIYKDPFRTPQGGFETYGLNGYCGNRVGIKPLVVKHQFSA